MLTFEQIKELIELVAERRLQGIEIERSGFRLKVEGQTARPAAAAPAAGAAAEERSVAAPPSSAAAAAPAPPVLPAAAPEKAAGPPPGSHILTSPIIGTFYRSSSPDAPPFTEVGARVKKGQVLCIIEAMKLMNEIESDIDGVVAEIYPQNAQPVEFGEPLFAIQPS